ncbi:major facilitator superfamily transporter [Rhodococcus opacus PD630]|uniref:MFS transporter n=1 Tax=Rhodococcus opacus TaxID=37919 RepID=UPI00029CB84A|nr:MFS transporter [Rhodococcus opacus]EHI43806.1 major facilitator superfamily transporter [Rhodococcus opacus PD630]UDG98956.1 MFS transporter [Rhodococcus opacus PD630]
MARTSRRGSLRSTHKYSWISLAVCWLIWVLNAYDREIILRLGPTISEQFGLSPEAWGAIASLIMLALAILAIPGSTVSDKYGGGWKRARFQVPLVIGYTALSFVSGVKAVSSNLVTFIALRVGVNLGAGWGEPVGVSNTAEWWPKERRGFALGVHHTGYPIGSLLSGFSAAAVLAMFGPENWSYTLFLGFLIAVPLMIFWGRYSTKEKMDTLYDHIGAQGLTPPDRDHVHVRADGDRGPIAACFRERNINLTALTTLLTQIVYMGINVVLPAYLYNIVGLSLAESAGLSVVFALTGTLGQVLWPTLSDVIGRRTTIVICGIWMAVSVACFYLATSSLLVVVVQLAFGLVANAVWPIYYAAASDAAPEGAISTANGIITTATFIGGGIAPLLMGKLISLSGGWSEHAGYTVCFFVMSACALLGVLFQLFTRRPRPQSSEKQGSPDSARPTLAL